ncbi:MAG: hypothetical protein ACE5K4_03280 [Candidatus Hydrothermarchaeota archaeon]
MRFKFLALLFAISVSTAQLIVDNFVYVIDIAEPDEANVNQFWNYINTGNYSYGNYTHLAPPFIYCMGSMYNASAYVHNLTGRYSPLNVTFTKDETGNCISVRITSIPPKKFKTIEIDYKRSDFIAKTERGYIIRDSIFSPLYILRVSYKVTIPENMQIGRVKPEPDMVEIKDSRLSLYFYDEKVTPLDKLEFYIEYGKFLELSNKRIKEAKDSLEEARISLEEARSVISTIHRNLTNSSTYYKTLEELNESYWTTEELIMKAEELKESKKYDLALNYSLKAKSIANKIEKNATKLKTSALLYLQKVTKEEIQKFKEEQKKLEEKISEVEEKRIQEEKEREREKKKFYLMLISISFIFLIAFILTFLHVRRGKR